MPNDLIKAVGGSLDVGIDEYSPDFSPEINIDKDSYNLTSGIGRGIGPRVGTSTFPGHADDEPLASTRGTNMRQAEGAYVDTGPTWCRSLYYRKKIFNVFSLKIGDYTNINNDVTVYAWLISSQPRFPPGNLVLFTDEVNLSLILNSSFTGPASTTPNINQMPYASDITEGFHVPQGNGMSSSFPFSLDSKTYYWNASVYLGQSLLTSGAEVKSTPVDSLLKISQNINFVSSINVTYSGKKVLCQYLFGDTTGSTADGSTPPKVNFWKAIGDSGQLYNFKYSNCGCPSSILKRNFSTSSRNINIYGYGAQTFANNPIEFVAAWTAKRTDMNLLYKSVFNYIDAQTGQYHVDFQNGTGTNTLFYGPIGTYGSIKSALVEDPECFTITGFRAVLAAPRKAIGWIIQDWLRSPEGMLPQVVDFANHVFRVVSIYAGNIGSPRYKENGTATLTSFSAFPDYLDNTPLSPAYGVSLTTTANSGIFRANSTYELTYSYYNKRLDFETNVGDPVKFRTGATDYVALKLTDTTSSSRAGFPRFSQSESLGILPWDFAVAPQQQQNLINLELNFTEIRFYYRRFGSFEWLPLYFVDAAKWWFYPFFINPSVAGTGLVVGESPIAGLPGGQPGGFIDHSRLPDQQYDCVVSFQDRIFWFSKENVFFSPRNNMFEYPVKNSISCRTGNFVGGMVHNYPGQAEQTSRLLIFGTREVYVARFTGNLLTAPVQVSDTTIGEYPVDASDLIVDTWTTNTAFSFRSAVVAEGFAYWWGPSGVYKDNGVDTPKKISLRLEPMINELYDPSDVANIHCSYDATTKEITWFYKPSNASATETKAITWNLIDEEWLPQTYNGIIDAVFPLRIETAIGNGGPRTVVAARKTRTDLVNRVYFMDFKTHGNGDIYPTKDFVIKQVSTPTTNQRRLTLAAGYDAATFATMAIGDLISLKHVGYYAPGLSLDEMLAEISAVNTGSGYIDIILPKTATMTGALSLTQKEYFPIYHKTKTGAGINGFQWRMKTKYWLPFGINTFANWLYIYILHKISLVKSNFAETYNLGYRSATSGDFVYDPVVYKNNSDGNWQLYHAFRTAETNNQGQALKLDLQGIQLASDIVLQFLEIHGTEQTGNGLKQFEG